MRLCFCGGEAPVRTLSDHIQVGTEQHKLLFKGSIECKFATWALLPPHGKDTIVVDSDNECEDDCNDKLPVMASTSELI